MTDVDRVRNELTALLAEIEPAKGYAEMNGLPGGKLASSVHIKLDMIKAHAEAALRLLGGTGTDPLAGSQPLAGRDGFQQIDKPDDRVQSDLRKMAVRHQFRGCVLFHFDKGMTFVNQRSWGNADRAMSLMDRLGSRMLADLLDGRHDVVLDTPGNR